MSPQETPDPSPGAAPEPAQEPDRKPDIVKRRDEVRAAKQTWEAATKRVLALDAERRALVQEQARALDALQELRRKFREETEGSDDA